MANQITTGDKFPVFTLNNEDGNPVNLQDHIGNPLVVYFYPKDDTPGCTKEACSFRDNFEDFEDAGAKVFGISADSPRSHKAFKAKHRLPFTLLSDRHNKIRKQLGIKASLLGLLPGRVTYIIDRDGTVKHHFTSQFEAQKHVTESLRVIKEMG